MWHLKFTYVLEPFSSYWLIPWIRMNVPLSSKREYISLLNNEMHLPLRDADIHTPFLIRIGPDWTTHSPSSFRLFCQKKKPQKTPLQGKQAAAWAWAVSIAVNQERKVVRHSDLRYHQGGNYDLNWVSQPVQLDYKLMVVGKTRLIWYITLAWPERMNGSLMRFLVR